LVVFAVVPGTAAPVDLEIAGPTSLSQNDPSLELVSPEDETPESAPGATVYVRTAVGVRAAINPARAAVRVRFVPANITLEYESVIVTLVLLDTPMMPPAEPLETSRNTVPA
jgi:hypothetical protein